MKFICNRVDGVTYVLFLSISTERQQRSHECLIFGNTHLEPPAWRLQSTHSTLEPMASTTRASALANSYLYRYFSAVHIAASPPAASADLVTPRAGTV